ncbi:MAG: MlaD family protein [Candidatus Cloacimonas sp.]|jgi:phospholipid/cholesterol/gamma-HCH transport system substrate-binding protein|nr:MlaD family protein [Candidatus Cloacimonas sp.]
MVSKATKIRLGVFIAIGSLLLLVFAGAVAGSRLIEKRDIYYIMFENYSVSGLQVGGPVNYQGIKVGRVETIKIDPKNVSKIILTISVDAGTPIKADTEAVLAMMGITGLKAVEIRGGTNEAALMKPKTFIKAGVSMFDDISVRAISIAEKIDLIATNIQRMTSEENSRNISAILAQTSMILADTHDNLSTTLVSISRIANNTADLTEGLSKNMDAISLNLTKNMDNLTNRTTTNIDGLSQTSQASLRTLTETVNTQLITITNNLDKNITQIATESAALVKDSRMQINTVGAHTDELVLESTRQIVATSANINRSLDQLNTMLYTPGFDSLMVNLGTLAGKLAQTDLNSMVKELSSTIQKTGNLVATLNRLVTQGQGNLLDTLDSLAEASENLNEFSKQISDTPSILLRGN